MWLHYESGQSKQICICIATYPEAYYLNMTSRASMSVWSLCFIIFHTDSQRVVECRKRLQRVCFCRNLRNLRWMRSRILWVSLFIPRSNILLLLMSSWWHPCPCSRPWCLAIMLSTFFRWLNAESNSLISILMNLACCSWTTQVWRDTLGTSKGTTPLL